MSDLNEAKRVLEVEAQCILQTKDKLGESFVAALDLIQFTVQEGGKVVVCGVGKSGKIGAKIAATLSSLGTPSIYLHPTEASHGDLGMVHAKDVVILISYSGGSEEIVSLLPSLRKRGTKLISILGNVKSAVAQSSDIVIDGSVAQEACPLNLAPTSSTTVALALGDALAVVLSRRLDFREEGFASNHPGGTLGRRLTWKVRDVMTHEPHLPWVSEDATMDEVVNVSTQAKLGAVLVHRKDAEPRDHFVGIITDGDIRRALSHKAKFFSLKAQEVMTRNPITVVDDEKALRALELMENRSSQISVLPVVNALHQCVGLVRLHDLIGRL